MASYKESLMNILINIIKYSEIFAETVFYISGSFFAWKGYTVWKKHIAGRRDHDLAKSILVAVYRYKEAFDALRDQSFLPRTLLSDSKEKIKNLSKEEILKREKSMFSLISQTYTQRYKDTHEIKAILKPLLTESLVVFGDSVQNYCYRMIEIENEVRDAIADYRLYFEPEVRNIFDIVKPNFDIIFSSGTSNDHINLKMNTIIKDIQDFLHPFLFVKQVRYKWSWHKLAKKK